MTRIIYDTAGTIFDVRTGTYDLPIGIPYLEVDIPIGSYPTSVDVSVTPHAAVISETPKSQELTRIEMLENAFNELLLG